MKIGRYIDNIRKLRGLTIEELANDTNITYNTILNLINNKTEPKISTILTLSNYFDIDLLKLGTSFYNSENNIISQMDNLVYLNDMEGLEALLDKHSDIDHNLPLSKIDFYNKHMTFYYSVLERRKYSNTATTIALCSDILRYYDLIDRDTIIPNNIINIDARLFLSLSMALIRVQDLKRSETILLRLSKITKDPLIHTKVYDTLSILYFIKGDYKKLLEASDKGIELCKKHKITTTLSSLYFWKTTAEFELESSEVRHTLNNFLIFSNFYDSENRRIKLMSDISKRYNIDLHNNTIFDLKL